ncbi:MAG TPA: flagellar basal body P-ring formation chaperone FlgA [Azospirillaceae bacterium]|nr:flagellar basal body P-ring formation chaperone FlgA [Azospirillaceae bacterium]
MIRRALLIAALCLSAAAAHAQVLRPEAVIDGDRVLLGDLFDGLAENAGVPVAQAPAPGKRAVFDADHLARLASAHRLQWRPQSRLDRSIVTRASTVIGAEAIRAALVQAVSAGSAPRQGRTDIELDQRTLEIHLPSHMEPRVAIDSLQTDPTGRFTAMLVAPGRGDGAVRQQVTGRIVSVVDVPVLARRMSSGEVITVKDVDWIQVREDRSLADAVLDVEQLIGQAPRRVIAAGQPIRGRDLQTPIVVARNAPVSMVYEAQNLTLIARGRATQDGAIGETIRVVNVQSNRVIDAVVAGPGLVKIVRPGQAQLVNN